MNQTVLLKMNLNLLCPSLYLFPDVAIIVKMHITCKLDPVCIINSFPNAAHVCKHISTRTALYAHAHFQKQEAKRDEKTNAADTKHIQTQTLTQKYFP